MGVVMAEAGGRPLWQRMKGAATVEARRGNEVGWFPTRGSYEEAVLSWYEQIEISFRRRELAAQRAVEERSTSRDAESRPPKAATD